MFTMLVAKSVVAKVLLGYMEWLARAVARVLGLVAKVLLCGC